MLAMNTRSLGSVRRSGRNARAVWKAPVRLVAMTSLQASGVIEAISPVCTTPAFATTMSAGAPHFFFTWSAAICRDRISRTSPFKANALSPIEAASGLSLSRFREHSATLAPSAASARTVASPIPDEAPVTNARRPSHLTFLFSFFFFRFSFPGRFPA